jgi:hypothetical protein
MSQEMSWKIQEGFRIEKALSGLSLPGNIAFVPNPKPDKAAPFFYVTELYGQIKVVTNDLKVFTFADKLLNYEPNYKMPGTGESGVIGIVVHENGDVFASMLYKDDKAFKNRYVGEGPASVCGLAFGPDGLYFTDLHGEVGMKKGEKSGGNVWKITKA